MRTTTHELRDRIYEQCSRLRCVTKIGDLDPTTNNGQNLNFILWPGVRSASPWLATALIRKSRREEIEPDFETRAAVHKNHANHGNHVNPVKLTFGHRHKQLFLQDYRMRPDLHDGSANHLDLTFCAKPIRAGILEVAGGEKTMPQYLVAG